MVKTTKEPQLSRYADLLSDAGFKAVLSAPRNRNLLRDLLNLIIPPDRRIEEIESYDDRGINGFTPFNHYSRVDIRCRDTSGRSFVVEMQRKMNDYFFQRCVWYASNVYGSDLHPGSEYKDLHPVYSVAFLEESLPHEDESLWGEDHLISCYRMTEKSTGEVATDTIVCIFVELGRFNSKDKRELKSSLEKILYTFKHAKDWDNAPEELMEDEVSSELIRACEIENFPGDVKLEYIRTMFTEMDYKAETQAYFKDGFKDGEKKGERNKARESAKNFLKAGVDAQIIAQCVGLPLEEVLSLKQN